MDHLAPGEEFIPATINKALLAHFEPDDDDGMPSDPPLSGLWRTDRMVLPAETVPGTSTLREEVVIWIDSTLGDNTVVVDVSRLTSMVVPVIP